MNEQKSQPENDYPPSLAPWLPEDVALVARYHLKQMEWHPYTEEALDRFQRLFCKNHEHEAQQRKLWGKLDNPPWRKHLYDIAKLSFDIPAHWSYVEPYKLICPSKRHGRTRPEKVVSQIVSTADKLAGLIEDHPFLNDFFNSHKEHKDLDRQLHDLSQAIGEWDRHSDNRSTNNEIFEGSSRFKTSKIAPQIKYFCYEMIQYFTGTFKRSACDVVAQISNLLFDTDFDDENIKKMTSDLRDRPSLVKK